MEKEKKREGALEDRLEEGHRREGLGTGIEREKIGGRKKVWGADFPVGKRRNSLEQSNWRGERAGMFPDFLLYHHLVSIFPDFLVF